MVELHQPRPVWIFPIVLVVSLDNRTGFAIEHGQSIQGDRFHTQTHRQPEGLHISRVLSFEPHVSAVHGISFGQSRLYARLN